MERTHRGVEAAARRGRRAAARDAIALLKSDHRQVEAWFSQFKKARKAERKKDLADRICNALKVHTLIEEEIFYPAFLAATDETELHHEAEVEHAGAKNLISQIEAMNSGDEYYDAKVIVLAEMVKHHVKEEEKPGGMFAKARRSSMDLDELGQRLKARKEQLDTDGNVVLRGIGKSVLDA
jgi:hemerythrin superfamily protein